jgi:hypothetical protein
MLDSPKESEPNPFLSKLLGFLSLEKLLLIIIGIGAAFRLLTIWTGVVYVDGAFYSALGDGIARSGDYVIPWSDTTTYSYSLTYPLYLAGYYAVSGYGFEVTKVASAICGLLVLPVVYLTTANLYDRRRGLVATAIISLNMTLIMLTSRNHIENMVLLFSIPAFWSLLKTKDNPKYYLLFGAFAGLTYLTKTDLGMVAVIIVAVAVFAWAFWHQRWEAAKNPYIYLGLLILVLLGVLRWFLASQYSDVSFSGIGAYSQSIFSGRGLVSFASQIPLHIILFGAFSAFWMRELLASLRKFRDRQVSLLWLGVLGLLLVIIVHAAAYSTFSLIPVTGVSSKYITIVFVPVLWLVFLETDFKRPMGRFDLAGLKYVLLSFIRNWKRIIVVLVGVVVSILTFLYLDEWMAILFFFGTASVVFVGSKVRLAVLLAVLLVLSTNSMTAVTHPPFLDATAEINEDLQPGDSIALHRIEATQESVFPGFSVLYLYPYLVTRDISIEDYSDGVNVTYVLSQHEAGYVNYTLVGTFYDKSESTILKRLFSSLVSAATGRESTSGGEFTMYLWKNNYTS